MKYLCPITEDCGGTLAPLLDTNMYLCNVCYGERTEDDFIADINQSNDSEQE